MPSEVSFRSLEASDVEVRVAQASEKGCSLLLYKDARCDMRILDEAVGAQSWACRYERIGDTLFCSVGISNEDEWVWKQDCGIPSSMESEKGEASDAFKRACFKWGIGRELYTAPFIWVPKEDCNLAKNRSGKPACYDRFRVTAMEVCEGSISSLEIVNDTTGKVVYPRKSSKPKGAKPQAPKEDGLLKAAKERLWEACKAYAKTQGMTPQQVAESVKERDGYAETPEWLSMAAIELEEAAE